MSRGIAIAALRGEGARFACGMAWLPAELLDALAEDTGSATRAQTLAAVASSIPVDLAFVDGEQPDAADAVVALHAVDVGAVWAVDGVFTRVACEIGWTETLRMTAAEPGALAVRLDEALHDALVSVRLGMDTGADAVLIGDDLAGAAGPLLSPDYALDALLPCYHRLALEIGTGVLPALFHSDGDIRAFLPALGRAGFSGVHLAGLAAEPFATAAAAARREGLIVLGGVGAQELTDTALAGERVARLAAALGGIVVCDDGGMTEAGQLAAFGGVVDAARDAYRHPQT